MTCASSRSTHLFDPTLAALVVFAAITSLVLLVAPAVASQLAVERASTRRRSAPTSPWSSVPSASQPSPPTTGSGG